MNNTTDNDSDTLLASPELKEKTDISKNMLHKKIGSRTASRLIAVQGLYAMSITDKRPSEIISDFQSGLLRQDNEIGLIESNDFEYTITILHGVVREQRVIDPLIAETLPENWSFKRLDKVACAILRCGLYELLFSPQIPPKVIMNEYTNLASSFGLNDGNALVNGILNAVARNRNLLDA